MLIIVFSEVKHALFVDLLKDPWRFFVQAYKNLHHHCHVCLVEHSNAGGLKQLEQVLSIVCTPQIGVKEALQSQ